MQQKCFTHYVRAVFEEKKMDGQLGIEIILMGVSKNFDLIFVFV